MKNVSILIGLAFFVTSIWASSKFFFGPSDNVDDTEEESTTEETPDNFSTTLRDLIEFIRENKRMPSRNSKNPEEKRLGIWCSSMRSGYKKDHLTQDKIVSLECVPLWSWDPIEERHCQHLGKLKEFVATHGRQPSLSSDNQEERTLAVWCMNRKKDYKCNRLSAERIQELEFIPFWSW